MSTMRQISMKTDNVCDSFGSVVNKQIFLKVSIMLKKILMNLLVNLI